MEPADLDRDLLQLAQRRVPLVLRPYAALAEQLGVDEPAVLGRLEALREGEQPVIREIAGVFEASALGYASALVACQVPPERLDAAGAVVAGHPGVSHCYQRDNAMNLWFTLTLGPESSWGLEGTIQRIGQLTGARQTHSLPTLRRYKIGVHVGPDGQMQSRSADEEAGSPAETARVGPDERAAVQALQVDLPSQPEPFGPLAAQVGLSVERLLTLAAELLDRRVMRRYGAVLHHRRAGLAANVMVAWKVSEAFADTAGKAAAAEPAVSHCYLRPAFPDWPYNLYTMIHGRTEEDCALVIDRILAVTGLREHARLWTGKEYKKSRVRYFTDEAARWEARGG